ncbi:MAG TPA: peptidoglycan-binding domain-containing protein [Xanthomonadales bacterium]|nr:peptidoglycan-binding domain-containing protein [Xanthomonadales bacterium]
MMPKWLTITICCLALGLPISALADELTQMAQQELQALGYDIDNTDGEATTQTIVAISKFQAEHNMEVTGEASPQLIGAIRAASNPRSAPAQTAGSAPAAAAPAAAPQPQLSLEQRQQNCLQEKYAAAQERNKKKRGMMRLLSAVTRTSRQFGDGGLASDISRSANEAYNVNATANDLEAAGKDLGLTPDEMEECRNPP